MSISRREFLQILALASACGWNLSAYGQDTSKAGAKSDKLPADPYEIKPFGNVTLMHFTDTHAQLLPVWFREPNINIGVADMKGRPPHLVGEHFLKFYGIPAHSREAYALTDLDYVEAAKKFGKMGGFAHL